jgi:hypothetical protein
MKSKDLRSVTASPGEGTQYDDLEREEREDLTNVHLPCLYSFGAAAGADPSVTQPPVVGADQYVLLKAEIVREGEQAASLSAPALPCHGLDAPSALPPPPVQEHGNRLAVAVGVLEAVVQIPLVPRHDQPAAHGWACG